MKTIVHAISDPEGLHARNAAALASEAMRWGSAVTVSSGPSTCSAADLMGLMALDVPAGDEVTVRIDGPDEDAAAEAIGEVLDRLC